MRHALVPAALLLLISLSPVLAPAPSALQKAWTAVGARPQDALYSSWAVVDHNYHSLPGLATWGARLAAGLGSGMHLTVREQGGDYRRVVYADASGRRKLVLESMDLSGALRLPPETYLAVDVQVLGAWHLRIGEEQVAAPFHGLARPRVFVNLEGFLPGRLSADAVQALDRRTFAAVGAHPVEGITDGQLSSQDAYSPTLGSGVMVAGKTIDLQVATVWDGYRGATRVVLGSPLITTTY